MVGLPPLPHARHIPLVLAAALCACGGGDEPRAAPADTAAAWTLSAEPRVRIGAGDGPGQELHRVYGGLVASDGRIVAGNSGTGEVRFFDARGRFLFASGREGSGPGEFRGIHAVSPLRGDSILVYDARLRRFSVLDAGGRFARAFSLPPAVGPAQLAGVLADGSIVVAAQEPFDPRGGAGVVRDHLVLLRVTAAGEVMDTVARVPGAEWLLYEAASSFPATQLPFGRAGYVAASGEHVVYASSDSDELRLLAPGGAPVRTIRVPAEPRVMTDAEVSAHLDASIDDPAERSAIRRHLEEEGDRSAPLVSGLRADRDGNLWVRLFPPAGSDVAKWVVLSPAGERIGSLRMRADAYPLDLRSDAVLVREGSTDGVEVVTLRALAK